MKKQPIEWYGSKHVYSRSGKLKGDIIGTTPCALEGCRGIRLIVRWPDGKSTRPCSKGCETRPDGDLQIM